MSSPRLVTSTIAPFDKNGTAQTLRINPSFSMESFEHKLRESIAPEVVDGRRGVEDAQILAVRTPAWLATFVTVLL